MMGELINRVWFLWTMKKQVNTCCSLADSYTCTEDYAHIFDNFFSINVSCDESRQRQEKLLEERSKVFKNLSEEMDKMCILFPIEEEYYHEVQQLLSNLMFVIIFNKYDTAPDKMISILKDLREKGIFASMRRELNIH